MSSDMTTLSMPPSQQLHGVHVSSSLRSSVIVGATVVAIAFGGFGTWAAVAPLDSAVIAHGQLSVEGQRKTIQHLEGGIVKDILVKEGDQVAPGQVLLRLDDAKAQANLDALNGQYAAALAQLARLQAERDNRSAITFPPELTDHPGSHAAEAKAAQQTEFDARRQRLEAQISVLEQRIAQLNAEITGAKVQQESVQRQLTLSHNELGGLRELAAKGYYPKNRLLAMERDIARLEGEKGAAVATEARARKSIAETEMQRLEARQTFHENVAKDLDATETRVNDLREQVAAAKDTVRRLEVVAPVAGTIQNIRVATRGGVVGAGQELMDLVPTDERLVIEARVQPGDIESVEADGPAEVRFLALKGRNSPVLKAKVLTVSADHLTDQRTGQPYYAARVEVPADQMARLDGRHVQAGMPVEVMIKGGERSALDYMLRPLLDSFATSFKER